MFFLQFRPQFLFALDSTQAIAQKGVWDLVWAGECYRWATITLSKPVNHFNQQMLNATSTSGLPCKENDDDYACLEPH
jgi:hypothetical protein